MKNITTSFGPQSILVDIGLLYGSSNGVEHGVTRVTFGAIVAVPFLHHSKYFCLKTEELEKMHAVSFRSSRASTNQKLRFMIAKKSYTNRFENGTYQNFFKISGHSYSNLVSVGKLLPLIKEVPNIPSQFYQIQYIIHLDIIVVASNNCSFSIVCSSSKLFSSQVKSIESKWPTNINRIP